uniref:S-adenosylmethionine mitochondrial carrier protein n=1 Tax=Elaeophora elaphi TaxID=1147741 RepID=A0A0R3RSH2_9BILA
MDLFGRPLFCGTAAGLAVDLTLYPLDTIKTRLQSSKGFAAAGGLRNLYRGMGSVVIGSAPSAALFFCTYNTVKRIADKESVAVNAGAASFSEVVACLLRVPTELVKQRAQTKHVHHLAIICRMIYNRNGFLGFYQGFFSTIFREIPFSLIEFPLWEVLKQKMAGRQCSPLESAACGSVSGGIAAAMTTPFDVVKTRIMLSEKTSRLGIAATLAKIWTTSGYRGLYAGIVPRSAWMGIGGFVFFGTYEAAMLLTGNIFF